MTDSIELQRWRNEGKAPAGSCPYCASRISMVERDGFFRARCSHRWCGATGPKMRSITRAADLFCCPPQRTAAGMAISARPTTGTVGELLATAPVDDGAPSSVTGAPDGTMVSIDRNATNPVVVAISKPVGRGRIWWGQRHMTVKEARMLARAVGDAADEIERGRGLVR